MYAPVHIINRPKIMRAQTDYATGGGGETSVGTAPGSPPMEKETPITAQVRDRNSWYTILVRWYSDWNMIWLSVFNFVYHGFIMMYYNLTMSLLSCYYELIT